MFFSGFQSASQPASKSELILLGLKAILGECSYQNNDFDRFEGFGQRKCLMTLAGAPAWALGTIRSHEVLPPGL